MEVSSFKIFNASAGSGKTYTLTKEYLKLLLSDGSSTRFRQILAVTFTNKAVDEMKSRILENLHAFGQIENLDEGNVLFHEICAELSLTPQQLHQRSKYCLKKILHNYSFFEVSTIDKFNHKLIKTFARDLQLAQNFEVELDTELLLEEAVGQLLEKAGSEKELTEVLISFSLEKIDEDKSWNIARDLVEIGKLLFQENHSEHVEKLGSKNIGDFKHVQKTLAKEIGQLENQVVVEAEKVLQNIESEGFHPSDFPRQTLPNHFKKIIDKEHSIKVLYTNKLEQNLQEGKILKAADKRDVAHLASHILEGFLSIKKNLYQRHYLKNCYTNIVPLTVLNEIAKEIKNIENEQDIVPISKLNLLLSKEIKNQPVPFIYERIGEKYRHYFIDEFQDTSQMQWTNLIPLIGNALESENERKEKGSLFIVGDVKQAIYRWRGGKAEQLLQLSNGESNPFGVDPSVNSLDTNWRSHSEVVNFNNGFFSSIAPFLKNDKYQNLFLEGCNQKTNNKSGGYVQLSFLEVEPDTKEEAYCSHTLQTIKEITLKKYPYSDICILVRDNKKGMLLANYLSENNIPIVSSDSLLVANCKEVAFLISLLKYIDTPSDRESAYEILLFLSPTPNNAHDFIVSNINTLDDFILENYGLGLSNVNRWSVLKILEHAIACFGLYEQASAHLMFLLDEVLEVERKLGANIHSFLKHWEKKKNNLSIAAPETIDAVQIMTIHKAKGLEFPFVIFPFANAIIDDRRKKKKSWIAAKSLGQELGLDEVLVNNGKEMLEYNEYTRESYLQELEKTQLDALNVLYVALTRAIKGLFVISEIKSPSPALEEATNYSDLFLWYLKNQEGFSPDQKLFSFGSLEQNKKSRSKASLREDHIPYLTRASKATDFTISTKSSQLWDDAKREAIEKGNLIHYALSQIHTIDDVPVAMDQLQTTGHVEKKMIPYIKSKILQLVEHPLLKVYFSDLYECKNEQEILTADGRFLRPDRMAIKGKEVSILDYKTGKPAPSHKQQIMEYSDVLTDMGFHVEQTIIVYIGQEINPHFL